MWCNSLKTQVSLAYVSFYVLQGADGVEYLIVAVEASTLMDFLENEDGD